MSKMSLFKRKCNHLYQKVTRGFSNKDLWALDWTIAKYIDRMNRRNRLHNNNVYESFCAGAMHDIAIGDGGDFIDHFDDKPNSHELYNGMYYSIYQGRSLFLHENISKFILPRLKEFRKLTVGYPSNLKSHDRWLYMLDCMIYDIENRRDKQGLKWFARYFRSLWW